jgi:hypothetical protein
VKVPLCRSYPSPEKHEELDKVLTSSHLTKGETTHELERNSILPLNIFSPYCVYNQCS